MTTHVFIVDERTFPLHLRYGFAGTGAGNHHVDFNDSAHSSLHHSTENNLIGMIADINRVRAGDSLIFYLQQKLPRIPEGKFYGVFRAIEDSAFLDNNDSDQYLKQQLRKSLTFRTLFVPGRVYPEGVTEWEALDEIRGISKPNQMLWSLIYRKLKGNRGCTMITEYEDQRLCDLLDRKNDGLYLDCEGKHLSFDQDTHQISCTNEYIDPDTYGGRREALNLKPRLTQKFLEGKSFEAHLQAEIVRNLGRRDDELSEILTGGNSIKWLGNEVSCGIGMQRIDLMLAFIKDGLRYVSPVELKSVQLQAAHIRQIQRYVDWVQQYYIPNLPSLISPTLITLKSQGSLPYAVRQEIQRFNERNTESNCERLRLLEFEVGRTGLSYSVKKY